MGLRWSSPPAISPQKHAAVLSLPTAVVSRILQLSGKHGAIRHGKHAAPMPWTPVVPRLLYLIHPPRQVPHTFADCSRVSIHMPDSPGCHSVWITKVVNDSTVYTRVDYWRLTPPHFLMVLSSYDKCRFIEVHWLF